MIRQRKRFQNSCYKAQNKDYDLIMMGFYLDTESPANGSIGVVLFFATAAVTPGVTYTVPNETTLLKRKSTGFALGVVHK